MGGGRFVLWRGGEGKKGGEGPVVGVEGVKKVLFEEESVGAGAEGLRGEGGARGEKALVGEGFAEFQSGGFAPIGKAALFESEEEGIGVALEGEEEFDGGGVEGLGDAAGFEEVVRGEGGGATDAPGQSEGVESRGAGEGG